MDNDEQIERHPSTPLVVEWIVETEHRRTVAKAGEIFQAAVALAGADGRVSFGRMDVREQMGITRADWLNAYTAVFQAMRDDRDGSAVGRYASVFHQTAYNTYVLSDKGQELRALARDTDAR